MMSDLLTMNRVWALPAADTFDNPAIAGFVQKYLLKSNVSVDPFATNKRWATYTNDLNPDTAAQYHMDAEDFLEMLATKNVKANLIIFDPPYSPRQILESYKQVGRVINGSKDSQNAALYSRVRKAMLAVVTNDAVVLSFGWNSAGMGKTWKLMELLLVCHGGAHNDTICMAERKAAAEQMLAI